MLAAVPIKAQNPGSLEPGAVQQQSNQTQQYYGLQKQIQQGKKPLKPGQSIVNKAGPKATKLPSNRGQAFLLQRVETNPSTILTPTEIQNIAKPYLGKQVSIRDLLKMVAQINALYNRKGYITARAFLPPQTVKKGAIRLELVEGRVDRVTVSGNKHTRASFYTKRIGLEAGDLIQTAPLEKKLVAFNQTSDSQVHAVLQAGPKFGTTDVGLDAAEPDNISTMLFFDNSGYDFIGRERVGLVTTDRSLFGYRDALTVATYWADGTVAGFAQYQVPVGTAGAYVGGGVSYDHIDIRSGSLAKLGVRGHFWDYSLEYSRPLFVSRRTLLQVYAAPHYQNSIIQSNSFAISHATDGFFDFGDSLQERDSHGFLAWSNDISAGTYHVTDQLGLLKYNGSFTRAQRLGRGFVGLFRAMGQARLAGQPGLPPSLEFQIGGISTVRGYPQGMLIGDNGYAVSAELDTPVPFIGTRTVHGEAAGQRFNFAFFIDHGGVLGSPKDSFLTGAGGGLIVNFSRYLTGHFDLATPLRNESNISHMAFEFYLQSTPPWARLLHRR